MKKYSRVLAAALALILTLSCLGTAFAADLGKTAVEPGAAAAKTEAAAKKGFQSKEFLQSNAYRYQEDEIVRAIVVLEGAPAAEVGENGSQKAASRSAQLAKEHTALRQRMTGINFELKYDFTVLLNGFSGDVAYGKLDEIAAMDGVKAVYVANHYDEPVLTPATSGSAQLTGNGQVNQAGLNGEGKVIAVLDTGLRISHEAFQVYEDVLGDVALTQSNTINALYVNAKIPYAYDYADQDDDVTDTNGHGTHVSGIAARLCGIRGWRSDLLRRSACRTDRFYEDIPRQPGRHYLRHLLCRPSGRLSAGRGRRQHVHRRPEWLHL